MSRHHLPRPRLAEDFEDIVRDVFSMVHPSAQLHGRSGQSQKGVDVYFQRPSTEDWIGIQCKARSSELSIAELERAVADATQFRPALSELIVATTAVNCADLQHRARQLSVEGTFLVTVLSWEEIAARLLRYPELYRKHYPHLFEQPRTNLSRLGFGIGLLLAGILRAYASLHKSRSHADRVRIDGFASGLIEHATQLRLQRPMEELLAELGRYPGGNFFAGGFLRFRGQVEERAGREARLSLELAFVLEDSMLSLTHIREAVDLAAPELLEFSAVQLSRNKKQIVEILANLSLAASIKQKVLEGINSILRRTYDGPDDFQDAGRDLEELLELLWTTI